VRLGERLGVTPGCIERWRTAKPRAVDLLERAIAAEDEPRNDVRWVPLPGQRIRNGLMELRIPKEFRGGLSEEKVLSVLREVAQFAYRTGYADPSQLLFQEAFKWHPSTTRRAIRAGERAGVVHRLHRYRTVDRRKRTNPRSNVYVFDQDELAKAGAAETGDDTAPKPVSPTPAAAGAPNVVGAPVESAPTPPAATTETGAGPAPPQEAASPAPPSRPRERAPDVKDAPKSVRQQIATGWCPEAAAVLDELQQLPQLAAIANRNDAAAIWAAAAVLRKPIDLVRKGLRELASRVAGGVEEATLQRAIAYALSARPGDEPRAAMTPTESYVEQLAREAREARARAAEEEAQAARLANEPGARMPVHNVWAELYPLPRRGRDPPKD
jgi:hypothetical protein